MCSELDPTQRKVDERAGDDQRDAFERDRDRILYSSALRRLAGVTQVVNPQEGHIFHNRLTHTIKVAQIGRRLAEMLQRDDESRSEELTIHPEVVEAAALAHDLGHPPFGHVGETTLNQCMTEFGRDDEGCSPGYEGNAQSFRIVTELTTRREGRTGLNLTRASLNALLKYPWLREAAGEKSKKWGAYHSEKDYFEFARAGTDGTEQSASAFLMDWADDIAYSTHDVEDFFRAGLIPLDRLATDDKERQRFLRIQFDNDAEAGQALDRVLGLVHSPLFEPFHGDVSQRGSLRFLISTLVGKCVRGVSFDGSKLKVKPKRRDEVKVLKQLASYYVFSNPALAAQQYGQKRVIKETFALLFEIACKPGGGKIPKNSQVLPVSIRQSCTEGLEQPEVARLVADAISGMTEQELSSFFKRLTGIESGSILNSAVI